MITTTVGEAPVKPYSALNIIVHEDPVRFAKI
jgi:hypothetical protein